MGKHGNLSRSELERRLRCVLVANCSHDADFPDASEYMSCNIWAAWVVAEVFGEQLFAPIWRSKARLDRYLRNGESPNQILLQYLTDMDSTQVSLYDRTRLLKNESGSLRQRIWSGNAPFGSAVNVCSHQRTGGDCRDDPHGYDRDRNND